jgi:hypothetical protein
MPVKFSLKKNILLIAHKLFFDILFFALIFFAASLLAESLLPGVITSHMGFSEILLIVMASILLIYFSGIFSQTKPPQKDFSLGKNKKALFVGVFATGLLLFGSFLKAGIFSALFLAVFSLVFIWIVFLTVKEE